MAKRKRRTATDNVKLLAFIFIILLLISIFFFDGKYTGTLINGFIQLFILLAISIMAGALVSAFTGDFFKKRKYEIRIFGFWINIPVVVLTFIIKIYFF
jgi:hypothetical protein